jgi:hypothetical protein
MKTSGTEGKPATVRTPGTVCAPTTVLITSNNTRNLRMSTTVEKPSRAGMPKKLGRQKQ